MKKNIKLKTLLASCLAVLLMMQSSLFAQPKMQARNILANEAKQIDLAKVLITDNSWNKLPTYKDRQFWQNLPADVKESYLTRAEGYLTYNWPVVRATDYLEFIRSGDRRQEAYSACSSALISLVMGELVEGKGRLSMVYGITANRHGGVGLHISASIRKQAPVCRISTNLMSIWVSVKSQATCRGHCIFSRSSLIKLIPLLLNVSVRKYSGKL
jgi:hypothetical protein